MDVPNVDVELDVGIDVVVRRVPHSVTSSWAGDGAYVVFGPLVARFPNGGTPSSTLALIFTEYRGTNSPTTFECEVHMGYGSSGVTKDTPFESCMSRTQ